MPRLGATARGTVALVAALLVVPAAPARAKSYELSRMRIGAELRADGSFLIREDLTFDFDGSFRRVARTIPLGAWSISEAAVSERGRAYEAVRYAGDEAPGTYVFTDDGEYEIRWFYVAADQERTFTVSYLVRDAVFAYDDVAELYWKFVGDQWEVPARDVSAVLTLPAGATREEIRAWGHGPLEGEVTILDGRTITWEVDRLPPRTFVEGRVAFPTALVPDRKSVV